MAEHDHTPSTLINAFVLQMRASGDSRPFGLKGLYEPGHGPPYGGYHYDRLREENGTYSISLKVQQRLRAKLVPDTLYTFVGSVDKRVKPKGAVELHFVVTDIAHVEQSEVVTRERETVRAIATGKRDRGFRDVERLVLDELEAGGQPRLHFIYGRGAVVEKDVMAALGEAIAYYDTTVVRVSMGQAAALGEAINNAPPGAVVAVVRGGGDLDVFNDPELARRVEASTELTLITALGHEADSTLLDQVADRVFSTPSALGHHLASLVERTLERQALRREYQRLVQGERQLKERLAHDARRLDALGAELSEARTEARRATAGTRRLSVALALAVGAIVWLLWR